jgi:hypothetical protein
MDTITEEKVNKAVNAILNVLGTPKTNHQKDAIASFYQGEYDKVRRLAATNLEDCYCKSLSYLGSAFKLLPNTDTILAESARAAAEYKAELLKKETLDWLGREIDSALSS